MTDLEYSITLSFLYLFLSVSVLGTLIIPIFFNDKMMKPKNKKTIDHPGDSFKQTLFKRIERLSFAGKIFILCGIVSVIFGWLASYIQGNQSDKKNEANFSKILQIKLDAKDSIDKIRAHFQDSMNRKDNEIADLTRKEQVAGVQKSVDSTNSKLTSKSFQYQNLSLKLQASQKENEELQKSFNSPVITEYLPTLKETNPSLTFDSSRNEFVYTVFFTNSGKGIAKNIKIKENTISVDNNNKLTNGVEGNGMYVDKYLTIDAGVTQFYMIYFDKSVPPSFVCIEIKYENSFNEQRNPFRNIYYFDPNFVNKPIPKLNKYQKSWVEKYLLDNKLWINS
ncbi:MAG: hypothetical protein ABI359_11115 [Ginsengibacter sp.]